MVSLEDFECLPSSAPIYPAGIPPSRIVNGYISCSLFPECPYPQAKFEPRTGLCELYSKRILKLLAEGHRLSPEKVDQKASEIKWVSKVDGNLQRYHLHLERV